MTTETTTPVQHRQTSTRSGAFLTRRSTVVVGVLILGLLAVGLLVPNLAGYEAAFPRLLAAPPPRYQPLQE